jgi:hypothetical protein
MKRCLFCLLAAFSLLVAPLLAGCGGDAEPSPEPQIRVVNLASADPVDAYVFEAPLDLNPIMFPPQPTFASIPNGATTNYIPFTVTTCHVVITPAGSRQILAHTSTMLAEHKEYRFVFQELGGVLSIQITVNDL